MTSARAAGAVERLRSGLIAAVAMARQIEDGHPSAAEDLLASLERSLDVALSATLLGVHRGGGLEVAAATRDLAALAELAAGHSLATGGSPARRLGRLADRASAVAEIVHDTAPSEDARVAAAEIAEAIRVSVARLRRHAAEAFRPPLAAAV